MVLFWMFGKIPNCEEKRRGTKARGQRGVHERNWGKERKKVVKLKVLN